MDRSKKGHIPFPLHEPHPVAYRDHVMRGCGFALIDPVAMANAFEVAAAVLQFVHEASVMYSDTVIEAELRRLKYRRSKNQMNPEAFFGGSQKSKGGKRS